MRKKISIFCNLPENFCSISSLYNYLHTKLRYTYKKAQEIKLRAPTLEMTAQRYNHSLKILSLLSLGVELVFIDESSFNIQL